MSQLVQVKKHETDAKKVLICGSVKTNGKLMAKIAEDLRKRGFQVIEPKDVGEYYGTHDLLEKTICRQNYFAWIRQSDYVVVVTRNHVGFETAMEMGYAYALGKSIYVTHEVDIDGIKSMLYNNEVKLGLPS